jgi:tRNA G18 (ribose-2'-O)-methylase SpoU
MEDNERLSAFRISLMNIIEISSLSQPEIQLFSSLTEAQLRNHHDIEQGIFIAESPKVIRVALHAGYEPISLLCERKHIENDAADIIRQCPDIPIYTGEREILNKLTGYTLTRGVLCAMRRKPAPTLEAVLRDAQRVCVIDAVCDTTNIGAIFRSAAALGIDSVLLTKSSCDPLNRRAVRVSMGSVFLVPWTWLDSYDQLREFGFCTAAMALKDQSIALDDPILKQQSRLALIMGTEGDGLPLETIDGADFVVRIPMYHAVDSLNVASAAAVAFWELCRTSRS